ncbi:1-aminocyclopropane-1-carboxylate oxidase 5 [Arachis stenosperma]|uniref:1-aminocyclopropane-1-carboxylate oxidase 5 n=1 Tax=Arachis stenosperma TaxID=217475 RepID=UPI0025ABF4D1|nr:1-aminocyclopropane-1-carboxylate oxidase 5 [Arachis stenosperma]
MAVPVIDFSKLNGEERAKTMAQIANGCEEWGFFQLINHGISEELLERVKKVCSEFYKLEREENFNNSTSVKIMNDLAENKNTGKLEHVDWEDVITLLDDNEWPQNPQEFRKTMAEYRSELKKLAEKMMDVMDENLGLPRGYMKKALNDGEGDNAFFGTKVSHYPPCPYPEHVNGLRAHTDAGGLILLFQDDKVGGLQMLKDGQWLEVQPLPNAIVINTGDQIEVLSNGRYKSCWHRVLVSTEGNRRSIASFYNPSLKATIYPAPKLVAEKENQQVDETYPKFVFGDYMDVYAKLKFQPKEPRFQAVVKAT